MGRRRRPPAEAGLFKRGWLRLGLILTLISTALTEAEGSPAEDLRTPRILSQGRIHRVQVGETLTLPCQVNQLGPMILLWKKGNRVLTAGKTMVRRDRRIRLIKGTNLQIADMNIHDGGEYSCEIEADLPMPISIVHTVEILVPPSIMTSPSSGEVIVRKATAVSLECKANGNPSPTVSWVKLAAKGHGQGHGQGHKKIHPRDLTNNGMILTLRSVGRRDAGMYRCTATNGVGKDAEEYVDLQVLYAPAITVHRSKVLGGESRPATLTCTVHAEPPAQVTWYKNTLLLDETQGARYRLHAQDDRHSLVIRSVGIEDFANYSCLATNSMGKEEGRVELRGNPEKPVFSSTVKQAGKNQWKIEWKTRSYANISEYRLLYRSVPDSSGQGDIQYAWNNVILPWQPGSGSGSGSTGSEQSYLYHLQNLEPDATYEAQVQARNQFGWSQRSEPFQFQTRTHRKRARTTPATLTSLPPVQPGGPSDGGRSRSSNHQRGGGAGAGGSSAEAQEYGLNTGRPGFLQSLQILLTLMSLLLTYLIGQIALWDES